METTTTQPPILVTVHDAAALLSVSDETIRRLLARGQLRAVRVGRSVRVARAELEKFVQENTN